MTNMANFTKEVSQLIENQFPEIYREEGGNMVAFVKAYYEFLESNDKYSVKLTREMFDMRDIDTSLDEFLVSFKETYLADFPFNFKTDTKFAIKNIVNYYRSKGSKESLSLLMKLLFNEDVSIYYPGEDVLKLSDSDWYKPEYIEVSKSNRTKNFLNREITGNRSGAKAFVENIVSKRVKGKLIDVLYLSTVRGNFKTGEKVSEDGFLDGAPKIKGSLSTLDITLGGRDNAVGDLFNVMTDEGVHGKVKVTSITNATGRVDFKIEKGGWGFTTDSSTDIYVSDAVLFANNANLSYITYETVYQPIETVVALSASNIMGANNLIGKYVTGRDSSNNYVANGVIVTYTNLDANSNPTSTLTGTGKLTLQVNSGTFLDTKSISLSSNVSYKYGETITEQGYYNIAFTNISSGAFTVGNTIEQRVTANYGTTITGLTSTLSLSNTSVVVPSISDLIIGQSLIKTSGTGAFAVGTVIKNLIAANTTNAGNQIIIDKNPLTAGSIVFTANSIVSTVSYANGSITAANGTVVTLSPAWGKFSSTANTLIVEKYSANGSVTGITASPTTISTPNTSVIAATGKIISATGTSNTIIVQTTSGTFDVGNALMFDKSKIIRTINSSSDSGVTKVYLEANNTANGIVNSTADATVRGMIIGQNETSIGVFGNTSPFFFANSYNAYVYTDRSKLISPPRYANGSIIDVTSQITRIAGGSSADFKIGAISDVETGVTLYTDTIGNTNVMGVPYTQISISGQNSGYGFVSNAIIVSSGSGYVNNAVISFTGGGYGGADASYPASGTITTNGSGNITSITISSPGEGYYEPPVAVLPSTAGSVASVTPVMNYGYGFPKNPNAEYNNFIGDILNTSIANIGTISVLSKINPGSEYTVDPFVNVRNKYISGYHRYDLILEVENLSNGSFKIGEQIAQTIGTSTSFKGRIKAIDIVGTSGKIYLERQSLAITFVSESPIFGYTSKATASLVSYSSDETTLPIGDNEVITGTAVSANGIATGIAVVDSGFGYLNKGDVTLEFIPTIAKSSNPYIITGVTNVTTQGVSEGYWRSKNSHLNSEKKIHDNKYYQEYSYDILSGLSMNRYEAILKKVFHVAGTAMFGTVVKASSVDMNIDTPESAIDRVKTVSEYLITHSGNNLVTKSGSYIVIRTEAEI